MLDAIEGFGPILPRVRVARPLSLAQTSEWAVELDFETHGALGTFLDAAYDNETPGVAGEFLKALHRLSWTVDGVAPAGSEGLVVSIVMPALGRA